DDPTESIPAFAVIALTTSFTYNTGVGITAGLIFYPIFKLVGVARLRSPWQYGRSLPCRRCFSPSIPTPREPRVPVFARYAPWWRTNRGGLFASVTVCCLRQLVVRRKCGPEASVRAHGFGVPLDGEPPAGRRPKVGLARPGGGERARTTCDSVFYSDQFSG